MTSGERMVFAAAFAHSMAHEEAVADACLAATRAVHALRDAANPTRLHYDDVRAMLDDMVSNGGDR